MLSQGVTFAIQMIATMVLARILTPADYGVVTMVTTFSVLLVSCGHVGFPDAVLQRDEIDHSLASNLFWINVGIGLFLTIGFAAAGSLLARFYSDARVAHIAAGASLAIFFDSTSGLHLALLKRAMRFASVSANEILGRMVSVAVSIISALAGCGYWALVAGAVAYPLSLTIGAWTRCRWVPSLPRRVSGTGFMVRFAANVVARFSVGYGTQNTDNLLVGWRFGSVGLGFYKKAYDLFVLPFNLLTVYPVAVSTLSRLNGDRTQYQRYVVGGLGVLALVGMGIGGNLTLVGKDIVRLILGPQWEEAGRIFMLFGPGIGAMLIYSTNGMIHLSIGTPGRFFRWGIIEFAVTVLLFLLTLRWGPKGIAAAWTASYWVLIIPAFWYAGKPIRLGVTTVLGAVWRCILASLVAGCASALILQTIPSLKTVPGAAGALARILTTSLLFETLYVGGVILLHGGCAPLYHLAGLVREMIPFDKLRKSSPSTRVTSSSDPQVALTATTPVE